MSVTKLDGSTQTVVSAAPPAAVSKAPTPPPVAAMAPTGPTVPRMPKPPATLADTGISGETVTDLIVKVLHVNGARSGQQLVDAIKLPFPILDEQLFTLQQRRMVAVLSTNGPGRGAYVFELTDTGRERARAALEANLYVGAAPVPLDVYSYWIDAQSVRQQRVSRAQLEASFQELVLPTEILHALGPAVNSSHSIFLHGEPGNGKTALATAISRTMGGGIYLPYAVEVGGQIVVIHDPVYHQPVRDPTAEQGENGPDWLKAPPAHDARFQFVTRPVVFVGGELTLAELDLQYDMHSKIYQAPFQLKAAGGVLIIDDFGRQQVAPKDLLNRWIVPLEKRVDYLTMHTGAKFPVPFDCLLLFATNLEPQDLVDEAFLRRIQYKVHIPGPERKAYEQIFERICAAREIRYDPGAVEFIYREWYARRGIEARGCHPRDIVEHVLDISSFEECPPVLSPELLQRACEGYFLVQAPGKH